MNKACLGLGDTNSTEAKLRKNVIGAMKGTVTTDPLTFAPENQILPQAFASPLRPAATPLTGASITAFAATGTKAYKLTYKIGPAFGYIDYSWDATNKYTFYLYQYNRSCNNFNLPTMR